MYCDQIATEQNEKVWQVCSEDVLDEIVRLLPQTTAQMAKIPSMGVSLAFIVSSPCVHAIEMRSLSMQVKSAPRSMENG